MNLRLKWKAEARWQICLTALLAVASFLWGQDNADPIVNQLKAALAASDPRAIRGVEQALSSQSPRLITLLTAGILLAQNEKFTDAATIFEQCVRQYPQSFEAKYNLALARISLEQYPAALDTLRSVSPATVDERAAATYLAGKIFAATNHLQESQKSLAEAYTLRPDQENYSLDLALLYIRSAAYAKAVEILRAAVRVHPQSEDLEVELALADVMEGNYVDGLAICRRLQHADSEQSVTRLIAAFAYCEQKEYRSCRDESSAGLQAAHPHPYLYYLRAQADWESGATDRTFMLNDVSQAIRQMPACSVCFMLRSKMFEAAHDNSSAIADLRSALAGDTNPAQGWYRLSLLYRKSGQPAKALAALRKYRSLHEAESNEEADSFRRQFVKDTPLKVTQ